MNGKLYLWALIFMVLGAIVCAVLYFGPQINSNLKPPNDNSKICNNKPDTSGKTKYGCWQMGVETNKNGNVKCTGNAKDGDTPSTQKLSCSKTPSYIAAGVGGGISLLLVIAGMVMHSKPHPAARHQGVEMAPTTKYGSNVYPDTALSL